MHEGVGRNGFQAFYAVHKRPIENSAVGWRGIDVAEFSFYEDGRINGFEGFDGLFGLAHVLLERKRGKVEDDGIKPGLGCLHSFG
ncbi:MAG: hypothetical protein JWN85_961 [Gammaproteobacteria bacterium]|nr:hypothetical protein [Gammaproteobacteria bacterium]